MRENKTVVSYLTEEGHKAYDYAKNSGWLDEKQVQNEGYLPEWASVIWDYVGERFIQKAIARSEKENLAGKKYKKYCLRFKMHERVIFKQFDTIDEMQFFAYSVFVAFFISAVRGFDFDLSACKVLKPYYIVFREGVILKPDGTAVLPRKDVDSNSVSVTLRQPDSHVMKATPLGRLIYSLFVKDVRSDRGVLVVPKDGNYMNCSVSNLELVLRSGLSQKNLTDDDVRYIRENYKPYDKDCNVSEMAEQFHMSSVALRNIATGECYKSVDGTRYIVAKRDRACIPGRLPEKYLDEYYYADKQGYLSDKKTPWIQALRAMAENYPLHQDKHGRYEFRRVRERDTTNVNAQFFYTKEELYEFCFVLGMVRFLTCVHNLGLNEQECRPFQDKCFGWRDGTIITEHFRKAEVHAPSVPQGSSYLYLKYNGKTHRVHYGRCIYSMFVEDVLTTRKGILRYRDGNVLNNNLDNLYLDFRRFPSADGEENKDA